MSEVINASTYREVKERQRRQRFAERAPLSIADLRELLGKVSVLTISHIDSWQRGELAHIDPSDRLWAADLSQNTELYDDEIESVIDEDDVMKRLYAEPANDERAEAIRLRRSVIVMTMLALESTENRQEATGSSNQISA